MCKSCAKLSYIERLFFVWLEQERWTLQGSNIKMEI